MANVRPTSTTQSATTASGTSSARARRPITIKPEEGGQGKTSFIFTYRSTPLQRIELIRAGVSASDLVKTGERMGMPKERVLSMLQFTRSTFNRRLKAGATLPKEYSERVIGLHKLIGQVEAMVAESGDPAGFDPARWVADWLEQPNPALNNATPASFMDTVEGQELASSVLSKMQSGAYA